MKHDPAFLLSVTIIHFALFSIEFHCASNQLLNYILDSPICDKPGVCSSTCVFPRAYIATPGFPLSYQPDATCLWKIEGVFGEFVRFQFINLDIINGDISCSSSYIEIFDLNRLNIQMSLGKFCKENRPYEEFTSNWEKLYIAFGSASETFGGRGFMGKYSIESFVQGPLSNQSATGSYLNICCNVSYM